MAARKTAAQKRAEETAAAESAAHDQNRNVTAEQEQAADEAQAQADELHRDVEEPSGEPAEQDTDTNEDGEDTPRGASVELDTEVTDQNGAPNDRNATGAVATANGVRPPEPGTETRVGIDGVADPVQVRKEPLASVGAFPADAENGPEAPEDRPNDPNAQGEYNLVNGVLPAEPGTETRVGIDGVADPKVIRKVPGTGVPGAPLDAPAPVAVQVANVEQTLQTPGALGAAMVGQGDSLVDELTGKSPNADELFDNPYGSTYVSKVRLMENVPVGNGSSTRRLVLAQGQVVSAATAQRFIAAVRGQQD